MSTPLYIFGTDVLTVDDGNDAIDGIPSVCAVIMGAHTQPKRGMLAGTIEVIGAVFLPTPLRMVVGTIGVSRIGYGLYKAAKNALSPGIHAPVPKEM